MTLHGIDFASYNQSDRRNEMSLYCPKCNRVVYNRRHKLCGFCGAELPKEFLFTAEQLAALDREEKEAERRKKQRQAEREAEEAARRAIDESGIGEIGFC
jgi:hypothetical protein